MTTETAPGWTAMPWRRVGDVGLRALTPVVLALGVGAVVLVATGANPAEIYVLMLREAFGGTDRIAATLTSTIPVLFTGLATAVAFRTGVFNVGVEGSFLAGGLAAAVVGSSWTGLPGPLLIVVALGAGGLFGMLAVAGPGWLLARWGVDEVVTTLLINFIVAGLAGWLVNEFLLAEGVANSATPLIAAHANLPRLLPPSQLNAGLLVGLAIAGLYAVWIRRSSTGYELRMVGINTRFSAAQGIPVARTILVAMLLSGVVGGIGGGVHTLGTIGRYVEGFSPGFGFTGIAVALLGRNTAVGVVLAAVLFGALASAGATVQLFSDIPLDIVDVLQGTIMIFAVVELFRLRGRRSAA